jgi:hypothetical protein
MLLGEMESTMMLKLWGKETGKTASNRQDFGSRRVVLPMVVVVVIMSYEHTRLSTWSP